MAKLAKGFKQVSLPDGTKRIFVGEDEFPWYTMRDSIKVDEEPFDSTLNYVTLTILVNGPVELK